MYNENQKKRYMEYKESESVLPPNYLQNIFKQSESFEELYKKDICNFNREEILDFYHYMSFLSLASYRYLTSILTNYNQWAFIQNLVTDGQNHFTEIRLEDMLDCINRRMVNHSIVTPEELDFLIKRFQNPRDQFLFLSLFEFGSTKGFADILNIKVSDIEGHTLHLQGRDVEVSDKWIKTARLADETLTFIPYDDNSRYDLTLVDNGYIYKNSTRVKAISPGQTARRVSALYRALRNYLELPESMNPKSIINSGRINMIKTKSQQLGISPERYCREYRDEITRQYGVAFVPSNFLLEYKDYL